MAHLAKDTLPPVMDKESLSKPYYSKDNNFNTVKVYDAPEKKHPLKPLPPTKEKSMFDTKDNKHSVVIPKKQSVSSLIKKNNKVNPNDFKNNGVADYLNQTKHCKRCQQKVYEAEKVSTAGSCWHKRCFRCNSCEKSLQMGQLSERNNEIFCNPCYARDFGPKGYGHGVGAGILTLTT
uniref:LIM zinc-binding domain-containing protein n=1 Tax=Rhabditophanes sp. KR3021 TaxID=114890 RepID=A0AC35U727_9BILA